MIATVSLVAGQRVVPCTPPGGGAPGWYLTETQRRGDWGGSERQVPGFGASGGEGASAVTTGQRAGGRVSGGGEGGRASGQAKETDKGGSR